MFGMFPYCVDGTHLAYNWKLSLYLTAAQCFFFANTLLWFTKPIYIADGLSRFYGLVVIIHLAAMFSTIATSVFQTIVSRKNMENVFQLLKRTDIALYYDTQINRDYTVTAILLDICTMVFITTSYIIRIYFEGISGKFLGITLLFWMQIASFLTVQPFCHMVFVFSKRIQILRTLLRRKKPTADHLERLVCLFDAYLLNTKQLNWCYSPQLLFVSFFIYISLVNGLYYTYVAITLKNAVYVVCIKIIGSVSQIFVITVVTTYCEIAYREVRC